MRTILCYIVAVMLGCEAFGMTTYHVRATGGSDSNDGLTYATGFATIAKLQTVMASGDTAYYSGIFRLSSGVTFLNLVGTYHQQEPGQTEADIRWEVLTGTGWTDDGGGKWHKTLATGLGSGGASSAMNGELLFQWNTTTDASGRPTGHLRYVAGAGAVNQYDYNNATGRCDINVSGSPNGATTDVSYSVGADAVAICFSGGSSNQVSLTFSLHCASGASYGLQFLNNTNSRAFGCTFRDAQWHHAGFLNFNASGIAGTDNVFDTCVFFGGAAGLGHAVHYADTIAMTGARFNNCVFHSHRYLSPTGAIMAGQSAMGQNGAQAHADSGTAIADILCDNCTFIEYEPGWRPISIANQAAASPTWSWSSCPARADRCTFRGDGTVQTGASSMRHSSNMAYRHCVIDLRNAGTSTLARTSGQGAISQSTAGGFVLFDACAIVAMLDDGANETVLFFPYGGAATEMRLINSSVHIADAASGAVYRYIFNLAFRTDNFVRCRGCAFSEASDWFGNVLVGGDDGSLVGQHDFTDNAYYLRTATWSNDTTWDTSAKWTSLVDTSGQVLLTSPFPNAPTALTLTSASSIWTLRRSTATVLPSAGGIDGPYRRFFGPYQPQLGLNLARPLGSLMGSLGGPRRSFWKRKMLTHHG